MHPILFSIGSFRLPSYGFLLAIALVAALLVIVRLGRREGLQTHVLVDFSTWIILVALVGAKVLMIVSDWSSYASDPREIFSLDTLQAGGVFYGGFIAAVLFSWWYTRAHHLPVLKVFDVYAPGIALGQSIGRLGCFAAGDDYGKPTHMPWGVVFKDPYAHQVGGVPLNVALHPVQLYESAATLLIFGLLMWFYPHKRRDGHVFLAYLTLYAGARFILEFFRGDEDRWFVFHHLLSTSQFIAILALLTAAVLFYALKRSSVGATGAKPVLRTAKGVQS